MATPVQLKQVVRRLGRAPSFTALALATLALGIGANAAIFSVVEGVLLRPLPYPRPDELVGVWHAAPGINIPRLESAPALYFTYLEEGRTFQGVGLWQEGAASVTGLAEPERVSLLRVTHATLPLLGVKPLLGRTFRAEEDVRGSAPAVVLYVGYWQRRFGGDPAAVGRRLTVDGEAREIIGVHAARVPLPRRARRALPAAAVRAGQDHARQLQLQLASRGSSRASRSARPTPTSRACCRSRSTASTRRRA